MNKELSSDIVYNKLKDRITSGYYLPGVHLVEADLIEEYQYSRTTIREALRRLVDDQIVELIPHRGARVKKLSNKEIMDSYILYEYLIALAVRLVTEAADPDVLQQLDQQVAINAKHLENGDSHMFIEGQLALHYSIINNSGNAPLIRAATGLRLILNMHYALQPLRPRYSEALLYHVRLVDAMKAHDADLAEKLIREDTQQAVEHVARGLSSEK